MSASPLAVAHATARMRLALAAARAARKAWRQIDRDAPGPSWLGALGPVIAAVAGAQLAAAQGTDPWLARLLGHDPGQDGADRLNPAALAGITGDGTPLAQALQVPVWTALRLVTRGVPVVHAMARGQMLLDLMVRTAVADAGRAADTVGMAARPAITSYIRVVESGACARCLLLAGREYGVSTGFARHPRCHCGMEPVTKEHRPEPVDVKDLYDQMPEAQRKKTFGEAAVKAIDAGADIGFVVNARRGMATATVFGHKVQATTAQTQRGTFRRREFQRLKDEGAIPQSRRIRGFKPEGVRLMPEEIFRQADGDREHAVRLLRRYAYIV